MTKHASDYHPGFLELVRRTCLTVLPAVGAILDDTTIVDGMVPSLLIGPELPPDIPPHVGTVDLDIGLEVSAGTGRYSAFINQLAALGFVPENKTGNPDGTRWQCTGPDGRRALVDVLPLTSSDTMEVTAGIPTLQPEMAQQLRLAYRDRRSVRISGESLSGAAAEVQAWVCGPGAFVLIKALTFLQRNKPKDAYDLYYVLRNFGDDVHDIVKAVAPLLGDSEARRAIQVLQDEFLEDDASGPVAVATFLYHRQDLEAQSEVAGFVRRLLVGCGAIPF